MKNILCFGAYSNGNVGDAGQAASLARHLHRLSLSPTKITMMSNNSADIDYWGDGFEKSKNMIDIKDFDLINSFDVLVIGGGGLFAGRHRPLNSANWVGNIKIPVAICAVGANPNVVLECKELILKSSFVSGRDPYSVQALRMIRRDVDLLSDPILCDAFYNDQFNNRPSREGYYPENLCYIPRKENAKNTKLRPVLSSLFFPSDRVISMFPATDLASGTLEKFKDFQIDFATQVPDLLNLFSQDFLYLSERYHGCILALNSGLPCIGVVNSKSDESSKILQLYKALGMEDCIIQTKDNNLTRTGLIALANQFDFLIINNKLVQLRKSFDFIFCKMLKKIYINCTNQ